MSDPDLQLTFARALVVVQALAAGEAMGRATEHYRPDEIVEIYEDTVHDFVEPVRLFDDEEWLAGETGDLLIALLGDGPSVPFVPALRAVLSGRGAAGLPPLEAALAAALVAALDGSPLFQMPTRAAEAARAAGDPALAETILHAAGVAQASGGRRPGAALRAVVPPDGDPPTVLAFAIGVAYASVNARRAITEAVNQGGHAPTTAALAGALAAALAPTSLPGSWAALVEEVNDFSLHRLTHLLLGGAET